jgi:DNA-binding CsgD family transcriptional regulator
MASLSFQDVRAVNAAVRQLYATTTLEDFSSQINEAMRTLLAGEVCAVNWIERGSKIAATTVYHPAGPVSEEVNVLAQHLLATQTPFWLRSAGAPKCASDFMSWTEWSRRDIHWACRQVDKEEFICYDVPLTSRLMLSLSEMRGRYGRYSPAERLKLQLLGPHLPQIYERLVVQTGIPSGNYRILRVAQGNVGPSGLKCQWTEGARGLLADYGIATAGANLPDTVKEWFRAQRRELEHPAEVAAKVTPLFLRRGGKELAIFLMRGHEPGSYRMLLQEREAAVEQARSWPEFGLSPRENEVLSWLTEGKTNPEIAMILGISPGTVRRHLENIYPKLGVENRHAAALLTLRSPRPGRVG